MLKIIVAMIIGAGLGAPVTHEILSRQHGAPDRPGEALPDFGGVAPQLPAPQRPGIVTGRGVTSGDTVPGSAAAPGARLVNIDSGPVLRAAPPGRRSTGARADPAIEQAASFEEAFGYALTHPGERWEVDAALMAVAERWLPASPAAAIAAVDRVTAPDQRKAYIEALARAALASRPELLGDLAAHLRGPNEQMAVVNAIAQAVNGLQAPEALLGVAETLPGMLGQALERMIYAQIAQRNPLEALARLDAMPPGESRDILLMSAITQLASRDPAGALSWLGARQAGLDPSLYANVAAVLGSQDPELAAQYTASVPDAARGGWISAVARGMAARDVDSALNWLSTWRTTSYYDDALAGVAQQIAGFDPARAAQLITQVDLGSTLGRTALASIAMMWANSDSDGALGWARSLPRGDARDRALAALAARVGEQMLDDAMLELFSSELMRDSAAGSAITSVARTDPARAQDLLATHITNPAIAQRISAALEGGQSGVFTAVGAPIAMGVAPTGAVFYNGAGGALPQLSVSGVGANFVITREAAEQ